MPTPIPEDPFDLLGLTPTFDLPPELLRRAYLARAAAAHPDLAAADEEAPARAAAINRARAVLENPERRANALLARLGGPAKESDKSLPDGFLLSMLETREEVETASRTRDPATLDRWREWAVARRDEYTRKISGLFRGIDVTRPSESLRTIRRELNAWRYIERLIEQLDPGYDPSQNNFDERS